MIDTLELVKFTAYNYLSSQDASVMDDNVQAAPEMFAQFEFEDKTATDVLKLSPRCASPTSDATRLAHSLSIRSRDFKVLDRNATFRDVAKHLSYGGTCQTTPCCTHFPNTRILTHSSSDHRVLIGNDQNAKLISQSDIVRYLNERKDKLDRQILNTPVGQLHIPTKILHVSYRIPTIKGKRER